MRRWIAGIAVAAIAGGAYFVLRDDGSPAPEHPSEAAPAPERRIAQVRRGKAPRRAEPERHYIEKPHDPTPQIKKWKVDGLPGTFREAVTSEEVPYDEAGEQLTYKMRRLRFRLTDMAATCYDGGDGKEQISFRYTMVVQSGELWVENVDVLQSNLSDKELERCIVDAVRGLRTTAPEIPDLRKPQRTSISQHDLWTRNRGA